MRQDDISMVYSKENRRERGSLEKKEICFHHLFFWDTPTFPPQPTETVNTTSLLSQHRQRSGAFFFFGIKSCQQMVNPKFVSTADSKIKNRTFFLFLFFVVVTAFTFKTLWLLFFRTCRLVSKDVDGFIYIFLGRFKFGLFSYLRGGKRWMHMGGFYWLSNFTDTVNVTVMILLGVPWWNLPDSLKNNYMHVEKGSEIQSQVVINGCKSVQLWLDTMRLGFTFFFFDR